MRCTATMIVLIVLALGAMTSTAAADNYETEDVLKIINDFLGDKKESGKQEINRENETETSEVKEPPKPSLFDALKEAMLIYSNIEKKLPEMNSKFYERLSDCLENTKELIQNDDTDQTDESCQNDEADPKDETVPESSESPGMKTVEFEVNSDDGTVQEEETNHDLTSCEIETFINKPDDKKNNSKTRSIKDEKTTHQHDQEINGRLDEMSQAIDELKRRISELSNLLEELQEDRFQTSHL